MPHSRLLPATGLLILFCLQGLTMPCAGERTHYLTHRQAARVYLQPRHGQYRERTAAMRYARRAVRRAECLLRTRDKARCAAG